MGASTHAKGRATTAFQPMGPTAGGNVISQIANYSVTADLSANDVFQMIKVPIDAIVIGGWISLDSSNAFTFTVGDGVDVDRYLVDGSVSGSNTMHVFPLDASGITTGSGHKYTADDTIDVKFSAITATVALNFTLCVFYIVDGQVGGVATN